MFRAVLAGREHRGAVVLKVAWFPFDPRFPREAKLLSLSQHPSVPKLLASGEWQHPSGAVYPYLVMEWVEGLPLYEWPERSNPSSQETSRVLAQVARALEATHAAGGLHRDVKGANILVSSSSHRVFLIDYGAGTYAGAPPVTRDGLPPGTDKYRSPETWEFELHRPRNAPATYQAQPADDVFALGVSAYRLVTGQYLPPVDVREEAGGGLRLNWTPPRPPQELNPRVAPELDALILRMLAARPDERPSAGELAKALETAARNPASGADLPLFARKEWEHSAKCEEADGPSGWSLTRARVPAWMLACAVLVGSVGAVTVGWTLRHAREDAAQHTTSEELGGRDPIGLGDTSLTGPAAQGEEPAGQERLGRPLPEQPLKGQRRAPHCRPPVEFSVSPRRAPSRHGAAPSLAARRERWSALGLRQRDGARVLDGSER
ncbi:serine/threonine-protein kinase, partial [Hyalangium rubrum]